MPFTYEYVPRKEEQYDGIDFSEQKTVDAEYRKNFTYKGNPFIEALPPSFTPEEVVNKYSRFVSIPEEDDFSDMDMQEKLDSIEILDEFRIAMPFHAMLEQQFHRALISSYSKRRQIGEEKASIDMTVGGAGRESHVKTVIRNMSNVPEGFTLLGVSGCGKSTGISMLLEHYPQVIIHQSDSWRRTYQIVYLQVNCQPNSNFTALYSAIGKEIDCALGNYTQTYEREVKRRRTLGEKKDYIRSLFEIFSVGILILDEIELIDLSSIKENSIETLLTLTNETGVSIAAVGTMDAYENLFTKRRTARRTGVLIKASSYCENRKFFYRTVSMLSAYQWRPDDQRIEYTEEMCSTLYDCTNGIISDLIGIYKSIERNHILGRDAKNGVTPEYIKKTANQYYEGLQTLSGKEHNPLLAKSNAITDEEVRLLNGFETSEALEDLQRRYEKEIIRNDLAEWFQLKAGVVTEIQAMENKYSQRQIESAFESVMKKEKERIIPEKDAVEKTYVELKEREAARAEKEEKKKKPAFDHEKAFKELVGENGDT